MLLTLRRSCITTISGIDQAGAYQGVLHLHDILKEE
jgi:hypothetical protein